MFNTDNFLHQNPWRLDKSKLVPYCFDRTVWNDLVNNLKDKKPILLYGPRGGGKTTLLQLVIKHLIVEKEVPQASIFYFNLDDILTRDAFISVAEVTKFIRGFAPDTKDRLWILIDEVSRLSENKLDASAFIKELQNEVGENVKLIMTVSGRDFSVASLLQNDKGENEGNVMEVGLFSFKEYLNRMLNPNNIFLPDGDKVPTKIKPTEERIKALSQMGFAPFLMPALDDYLRFGGYASIVREYVVEKRPALLRELYQGLFSRQIHTKQDRLLQAQDRQLLVEIARLHGNVLNINKLANETKLNRKTISSFMDDLEESYLINKVYPYAEDKKAEKGMPMVYLYDNGMRNMLLDTFTTIDKRPDRKVLLDNMLYNELRIIPWVKDIRFWNSETSDVTGFVFRHGVVENMIAVLYDFPKEKPGRWALVNMARKVKAKKVIILTKDYSEYDTVGPTKTIYIPVIWTWFVRNILEE